MMRQFLQRNKDLFREVFAWKFCVQVDVRVKQEWKRKVRRGVDATVQWKRRGGGRYAVWVVDGLGRWYTRAYEKIKKSRIKSIETTIYVKEIEHKGTQPSVTFTVMPTYTSRHFMFNR